MGPPLAPLAVTKAHLQLAGVRFRLLPDPRHNSSPSQEALPLGSYQKRETGAFPI